MILAGAAVAEDFIVQAVMNDGSTKGYYSKDLAIALAAEAVFIEDFGTHVYFYGEDDEARGWSVELERRVKSLNLAAGTQPDRVRANAAAVRVLAEMGQTREAVLILDDHLSEEEWVHMTRDLARQGVVVAYDMTLRFPVARAL